jgi:hypothetical protein
MKTDRILLNVKVLLEGMRSARPLQGQVHGELVKAGPGEQLFPREFLLLLLLRAKRPENFGRGWVQHTSIDPNCPTKVATNFLTILKLDSS